MKRFLTILVLVASVTWAVELDPKFHEARANFGALRLAMEDWEGAIELLMPLTREPLYPTPYLVNNNIGWAYYNLKKYPLASKYIKMAIFLNPKTDHTTGLILSEFQFSQPMMSIWASLNR